jgi:hypothetical protein
MVFLSVPDSLANAGGHLIRVGIHSAWRTVPTLQDAEYYTSDRAFVNVPHPNSICVQMSKCAQLQSSLCNSIAIVFINEINNIHYFDGTIYAISCTYFRKSSTLMRDVTAVPRQNSIRGIGWIKIEVEVCNWP